MIKKHYKKVILLLMILQFLDGLLTSCGIAIHGSTDIEGNPLIKYLCDKIGFVEALALVKGSLIYVLYKFYHFPPIAFESRVVSIFIPAVTLVYLVVVLQWLDFFLIVLS